MRMYTHNENTHPEHRTRKNAHTKNTHALRRQRRRIGCVYSMWSLASFVLSSIGEASDEYYMFSIHDCVLIEIMESSDNHRCCCFHDKHTKTYTRTHKKRTAAQNALLTLQSREQTRASYEYSRDRGTSLLRTPIRQPWAVTSPNAQHLSTSATSP